MSFKVTSWALNEAPVELPVQVLILVAMAERCNDDGTCSYQSAKTIASKARISTRTVQREFKNLESLGVIRRGDQSAAEHLPSNRRPIVYDLAVELRRGDNLTYQDSATSPVSVQEESDTTSTTARYDNDDSVDTTLMADNSSFITSPITTKESLVSTSPSADPDKEFLLSLGKLDAPDHPQWMSDQTAITATGELTKIGRTLVESVQSYYAGPLYTGKPDEKQYKQWLGLERRSHAMKQPLPVRDVVRADTPATLTQAFESFWQAYPKKQKRVEALNEFTAAVKGGVAADLIITGAKRFTLAEGSKDPQYLPFPGTWLRDGRWADEYKTKSWSHTASDD